MDNRLIQLMVIVKGRGLALAVKHGHYQVQRVVYRDNGTSIVDRLSPWLTVEELAEWLSVKV